MAGMIWGNGILILANVRIGDGDRFYRIQIKSHV
jgi:hypothetical protein